MKRSSSTTSLLKQRIDESAACVLRRLRSRPTIGIVLGSGLGEFAERLDRKVVLPTSEIPHYPQLTVEGHKGRVVAGKLGGKNILAFQGRVHYYEVGDVLTVLYPIHVAHRLGIRTLIVTNAAGGINPQLKPADLMLISDHINLTFEQPLATIEASRRTRKNEVPYNIRLRRLFQQCAMKERIPLMEGVYCCVKGPSYETAAEVEMIRRLGGDAVGMSTVNEVTLATALGMRVAGISCITNYATGIGSQPLSHSEVTEVANQVKQRFARLIESALRVL